MHNALYYYNSYLNSWNFILIGGLSNAILYPMDTLKTMRQTDPNIKSVRQALIKLKKAGIFKIYSGMIPAILGSIPSSALYFGSYETAKSIFKVLPVVDSLGRPAVHMLSAACGNVISSIVFVPKDLLKQQMQALRTGSALQITNQFNNPTGSISLLKLCRSIWLKNGWKGFYPNYRATLMRNIPSAIVSVFTSTC
jgi:hypothetical protein